MTAKKHSQLFTPSEDNK